jgi:hypothetical protein
MEDTQHSRRVVDDPTEARTEESGNSEATAQTVARLLANPRRVRRA